MQSLFRYQKHPKIDVFLFQEVESEFKASLTINTVSKEMAGKTNTLTIKNDEGETVYSFKLGLGDKPPSGESFLNNVSFSLWFCGVDAQDRCLTYYPPWFSEHGYQRCKESCLGMSFGRTIWPKLEQKQLRRR